MKMAATLGEMKGAAMKMGQLASFVDTEFLPPEYARDLPGAARAAAHLRARDAVGEGVEGPRGGVLGEPLRRAVRRASSTRRSRPRRSARCTAPRSTTAAPSRSRSSTRGRRGARVRHAKRRRDHAAGAGVRPGPRREGGRRGAAAAGHGGARLRVRGAEPAQLRARLPRPPVHLRARRADPPVAPPGAGDRVRRGRRVRGRQGASPGRSRPLRRDRLPVQLRLDLPPAAVQRRSPPGQLHPDARRPGRLPRLRDDQAARPGADRAGAAGDRRRRASGPGGAARRRSTTSASSRTRRSSTPSG